MNFKYIAIISAVLLVVPVSVFAITPQHTNPISIGITLSKTCLTELQHNIKTKCPTYKPIVKYDNTDKFVAGDFVETYGFYHREKPRMNNYFDIPRDHVMIAVDPSEKYLEQSLQIEIEGNDFTFVKNDAIIGNNHTRIENTNVFVDSCHFARIAYSDQLLNDTINYLKSGCIGNIANSTKTVKTPMFVTAKTNPFSSQHQQYYLTKIFKGHTIVNNEKVIAKGGLGLGNCINHKCNFTDPYAKAGYGR